MPVRRAVIKEKRAAAVKRLQAEGKNQDYIKSYLRGWDSVSS